MSQEIDFSFEEYYAAVKKSLMGLLKYLSEDEAEEYLQSEITGIRGDYEDALEEYKRGEVPIGYLKVGGPATVAYDMAMSY